MTEKPKGLIPQTQVQSAVRNFFRGEVLNKASKYDGISDEANNGFGWLREEIKEAVKVVFAGTGQSLVRQAVRDEINAKLAPGRSGSNFVRDMVSEIIRQEVKKLVIDKLNVSASLQVDIGRGYGDEAQF